MKPSWKVVKPVLVSSYTFLSVSNKLTTQTLVHPSMFSASPAFQFSCLRTKYLRIDAKFLQKEFITSINITTVLNFQSKTMKKIIM